MGALAPSSPWLPQDDLLLKESIEGGASLESLARGAKRFSRRFTLQELQERWYSLLYDPVVSAEASVHMLELDTSASTAQSKSHKETKHMSGKRRSESVRNSYYSMLKRIRNDPLDMMDMDFLDGTGYCDTGNRDNPSSVDCYLADQGPNVFGNSEPIYGGSCHPFPEQHATGVTSPGDGVSASTFHGGLNYLNGNTQESPVFCEKNSVSRDQNAVEDFIHFKESSDLVMKGSPTLCQYTDDGTDACYGFGCEVLNSSAPGCGTSPNFGYSPMSEMPSWIAGEDFDESALADALGIIEQPVGTELGNPCVVANEMTVTENGTASSLSNLIGQMSCDNMNGSAAYAEEYLKELSNSLLNCSTDELLLVDELLSVDTDGLDMIDNTYMENSSPLLLDFPDENDMPNVGLTETQVAFDDHIKTSVGAHGGESDAKGLFSHVDQHLVGSAEPQKILSALKVNTAFPELRNGVICCVLNTEDPEIPNNDDVFLPFRMPSMSTCPMGDAEFDIASYPSSSSVDRLISNTRVTNGSIIMGEPNNCDVSSRSTVHQPEVASGSQTDAQIVTYELPSSEGHPLASLTHCYNETSAAGAGKESIAITDHPNIINHDSPDSLIPKHDGASDSHLRFQRSRAGSEWELIPTSVTQNHEPLHTAQQCIEKKVPDSVTDSPMSDVEEFSCESDGDVPYCSDIESLILDMDLIPDDQDLYSSERVLKYQNEDAKRIIMRLEQAADSYIRRAMSSHGAFAVLCGRHSKHFIKKTEVLLGRATEDVKVDIDLGTEARANKISRRQATIKVDIDGAFYLKNYGKQPIHVNGREVVCGEEVAIVSGSLLEIRGIAFIFETNRAYVKHHFDNLRKLNLGAQESRQLIGC